MISAALRGDLNSVSCREDPLFGLHIPEQVPDVPSEILQPRTTWQDQRAYDEKARHLAVLFHKNFEQFSDQATPEIRAAGPRLGK
jgi:phosphoenolpyruvate carboxykinase (ATP)